MTGEPVPAVAPTLSCSVRGTSALHNNSRAPQLTLIQQRLVDTAVKLANSYPANVRATWVKAAQTLRAPYWDWALQDSVPTATVTKRLTITIPNGSTGTKQYTVDNPLAAYFFPKKALDGTFGTFDQPANRPQIYRCRSPQSYPGSANSAMRARPYKSWVVSSYCLTDEIYADLNSTMPSLPPPPLTSSPPLAAPV